MLLNINFVNKKGIKGLIKRKKNGSLFLCVFLSFFYIKIVVKKI